MARQRAAAQRRHQWVAHNRKLTFAQAESIRADAANGFTLKQLAKRYDCNYNSVRAILEGRTYVRPTRFEQAVIEEQAYRVPMPAPPNDPRLICRMERAKRSQRNEPAMSEAAKAFAALLARDVELRKGGRPRKDAKPGKPRLFVERDQVPDLTTGLNPFFGL